MERATIVWTKTPDAWAAIIEDQAGHAWDVTIRRALVGMQLTVSATLLCQERLVGGGQVSHLKSKSTFRAFEEAEAWVYATLGMPKG